MSIDDGDDNNNTQCKGIKTILFHKLDPREFAEDFLLYCLRR